MSEEKTEQPTRKKIRDSRKKGQVFKSKDLTQAFLFLTAVGVLAIGGPACVDQLKQLMADSFRPEVLTGRLREDEILHRLGYAGLKLLVVSAPFLAAVTVVAAAVNFLQVQALFAPEAVRVKFEKLNPIKGFQNIFFKSRTYLELVKNLVKFAMVAGLAYLLVKGSVRDIVLTASTDPLQTGKLGFALVFNLFTKIGVLFLVIGAADFFLQKKLYMKELKMSKYEVKKEHKEEEGDPHVKHARRHLHRELLAHGMAQNVPRANAIVVNPTHLAIAVEYDDATMNAPLVTAKGQGEMAQRIIELAKKSRVPIVRNVPLAHGLYDVDIGGEIPESLYAAVAEVLNWVYELAESQKG